MTETKQEKFSFEEIVDDSYWSVADVRENDTVKPIKNKDGNIIEVHQVDYSKKEEEADIKQIYLMNCTIQEQDVKLKLPKKTMINLKKICSGKVEALIDKTFKVHIEGEGTFKFVSLLLS